MLIFSPQYLSNFNTNVSELTLTDLNAFNNVEEGGKDENYMNKNIKNMGYFLIF